MPRRKISEYRAKNIVNDLLESTYTGWSVLDGKIPSTLTGKTFVVKVDQAVKQRFKRGLIYLDVAKKDIQGSITALNEKGYDSILVEPYLLHDGEGERYISLRRERDGVLVSYSKQGGVEIEAHSDSIKTDRYENFDIAELSRGTGFSVDQLIALRRAFDDLYLSFLEINPYVIDENGAVHILDVAIEVDSAAELLVDGWDKSDVRTPASKPTQEEIAVRKLDDESPASFSLEQINPDGGIFLLLSGGGASVVIADEIFTLGYGNQLANYGEYSGNPNEHEAELYANQVFSLLHNSKAPEKVVFIGGAVANFTDIQSTFKGIIGALRTNEAQLVKAKAKFYVRRGGPRQTQGLKMIKAELDRMGLLGGVYGPSVSIPEAVASLVSGVKK